MVSDLCGMQFDDQWNLKSLIPPTREIPVPILFGALPFSPGAGVIPSLALAASQLTTYLTLRPDQDLERYMEYFNHLVVSLRPEEIETRREILEWATIIEIEPGADPIASITRAHQINPHLLTVLRIPAARGVEREILRLSEQGAETIHLSADIHGRGEDGVRLLDCLRDSHRLLECTVCGECRAGRPCPRQIESVDPRWGAARVINLMLAWRDQLLEVLGAMGMRDVRRLRGETGRAVFADVARKDFLERLTRRAQKQQISSSIPSGTGSAWNEEAISAPARFPFRIGFHRIVVDRSRCTDCGICADSCRYKVHRRIEGKVSLDEPLHGRCIGTVCL
jgi:ferredoxin